MSASNYFKIVDRDGGRIVDTFAFDGALEADIYRAWREALKTQNGNPSRKIVLGSPVSIKGSWSSLQITGVNVVRSV